MKKKYIALSFLLGSVCSTVHAEEVHRSHVYFSTSSNVVKVYTKAPSYKNWILQNYNKSFFHSLLGFCFGYQFNNYLGVELSYDFSFLNDSKNLYYRYHKYDKTKYSKYVDDVNKKLDQELEEEDNQVDVYQTKRFIPSKNFSTRFISTSTNKNSQLTPNKVFFRDVVDMRIPFSYFEKNIKLTAKFSYPFMKNINLYTRFGGAFHISQSAFQKDLSTRKEIISERIFYPLISCGIQYDFANHMSSRFEIEKKLSNFNDPLIEKSSLNFDFVWKFNKLSA
ncbi:hypothetical protein [Buchnera aphidicola]|uniref:hypothetical protein n=1 Tax=Buchnera aphidicola TaxID=9 RepID=UPI003464AAB5